MLFQFNTSSKDSDLEQVLKNIPARGRSAAIRVALRAYLLPGGQKDVMERLEMLLNRLDSGIVPHADVPSSPTKDEEIARNASAVMIAFGLDEDE